MMPLLLLSYYVLRRRDEEDEERLDWIVAPARLAASSSMLIMSSAPECEFMRHFRLPRVVFEHLVGRISDRLKCSRGPPSPLSPQKCVEMTLWTLATGESVMRFCLSMPGGS
jgi:hypothetical protein